MRPNRLRERREELRFTQAEIAERVGVEKGTYYRYEKGSLDPVSSTVEALARVLEVSSDWLLGLVDEKTDRLQELNLSVDERALLAAVRNGKLQEAVATALELANGNQQAHVAGKQPAANS